MPNKKRVGRKILDAIGKVMCLIHPVGVRNREAAAQYTEAVEQYTRMVRREREAMMQYARSESKRLCEELIKRGDIDTVPDISVFWDEEYVGAVVNIELPSGAMKLLYK